MQRYHEKQSSLFDSNAWQKLNLHIFSCHEKLKGWRGQKERGEGRSRYKRYTQGRMSMRVPQHMTNLHITMWILLNIISILYYLKKAKETKRGKSGDKKIIHTI